MKWSSYGAHALGQADELIRDHSCYLALGATDEARQAAYQALFRHQVDKEKGRRRMYVETMWSWFEGKMIVVKNMNRIIEQEPNIGLSPHFLQDLREATNDGEGRRAA